ncbi:hypothetical protein [Algoriphagus aquimarinus]|uniref:Sulfotransferase family protein n=1 Tax=Algoriphagus aquimarinus TaxID=237018 RepID=A0A1I1C461_9BACT|nr:hypothetical protein [Algoriphagus aquimarinus]SFB55263.1 hypothetical protein SAMN04489723_11970 [Algoriphagus aquimarinus]
MPKPFSFPIHTCVTGNPVTYCEEIIPEVFQYPFFNQGVSATRKPLNDRKSSILGDITAPTEEELLPIRGFIFHTSHCGSTLLGRMLGSSSQVRMISEPESINGLLLSYLLNQLPEAQILTQLKQIIEAYRIPGDGKKSIVFKLTSWNVFLIHLFQKLYPNTPWMYIDRNSENLVKTLKNKDGGFIEWWHHPVDMLRKHFVDNSSSSVDFESYLRSIVAGHRKSAVKAQNGNELFVLYPDFLNSIPQILAHFQLSFSEEELEKSLAFQRYNSKEFEPVLFEYSAEHSPKPFQTSV